MRQVFGAKMQKVWIALSLVSVLLAGCGHKDDTTASTPQAQSQKIGQENAAGMARMHQPPR